MLHMYVREPGIWSLSAVMLWHSSTLLGQIASGKMLQANCFRQIAGDKSGANAGGTLPRA